MEKHKILIFNGSEGLTSSIDSELFDVIGVLSSDADKADFDDVVLTVVDKSAQGGSSADLDIVMVSASDREIPVVLVSEVLNLRDRVKAMESGFQDVISTREPDTEINSRLIATIYHTIANRQLKQNLAKANTAAYSAMTESGNLGTNVNFLLASGQCSSLDELAQLFFQSASYYGIQCSLQIRHRQGIKNMDANGMARPLESELLTQFKDMGRYYDFGRRTICNYGSVSILIKNMPEDELIYGTIKDNSFSLVQGLDSRVKSMDEHLMLQEERDMLSELSISIKSTMESINDECHQVMTDIVTVIENTSDKINKNIPSLTLNDEDEKFIEESLENCIAETNMVFSEGLKISDKFSALEIKIEQALENMEKSIASNSEPMPKIDGQDVELF